MRRLRTAALAAAIVTGAGAGAAMAAPPIGVPDPAGGNALVAAVERTDRSTAWRAISAVTLGFPTYHPQGMVRVGDAFYMTSVEILEPTERYPTPQGGYDRTAGRGVGHLFKFDAQGNLLADLVLGEGAIYHPGGLDYDGESLWVPVAEYRPDSRAIVYRVDPATMAAKEAFRVNDHVGGVVVDRERGRVSGVSWGSRRLYRWAPDGRQLSVAPNESNYVDFQDCQYAAAGRAVCTGVTELPRPDTGPDGERYRLGGYAVLDTRLALVGHEVPLSLWDPAGQPLTRNPTHLEALPDGRLRLYAAPADDTTTLYVYDSD